MEFSILNSGIRFDGNGGDRPSYVYFHLHTPEQGERWRVIALRELCYLPQQDRRHEDDILGRQWAAVRGLYSAGVNFAYATGGIFSPRHIGVVQWYGAVAEAAAEERAAAEALAGLEAVLGLLANYPQSRTADPDPERLQWYLDFVRTAPRVLAVLGHPDPRMSREGVGQDGAAGVSDDDLAREQTEMFLRALVARRKQFVFHVTADHVGRGRLTEGLVTLARISSDVASRQRGDIRAGVSVALPFLAASSQAWTGSRAGGRTQGRSHTDGVTETRGEAHTESRSHTEFRSHSVTDSEAWGEAHTVGRFSSHGVGNSNARAQTSGEAHTEGQAHTEGRAHTEGQAETAGTFSSVTHSQGSSWGSSESVGGAVSHSHASGQSSGVAEGTASGTNESASYGIHSSQGQSQGTTETSGWNVGGTVGGDVRGSAGVNGQLGEGIVPAGIGADIGGSAGINASVHGGIEGSVAESASNSSSGGWNKSDAQGSFDSQSHVETAGMSEMETAGETASWGASQSHGGFSGTAYTQGQSHSVTRSSADTRSESDTHSEADTVSQARSRSRAWSITDVAGESEAWTTSHMVGHAETYTHGSSDTEGEADTESHAVGRSHADGVGESRMVGRGGAETVAGTISRGIVPGVSLSRGWQTEDDVAARVTEVLRGLQRLLNTASAEGGFMTQATIFVEDEEAQKLAAAAVGQAYHGLNAPTPVGAWPVREEDLEEIRMHALTARPCMQADGDPFGGVLWSRYATLLTAGMLSAYTRPARFEEGVTTTVQEAEPPYAFYPDLKGQVFLGHQYSYETGQLTDAPLLLSRDRVFHTLFAADTGYGKSVAAMRMAYETTVKWHFRTLVMEFSTGWRALVNAPGLEGHFQIFQLSPGGAFPLRWNPLEIGRHIEPETQWRAFCDVFGGIARMGVRRQVHDFRRVLKRVYLAAGVLVRDREVVNHRKWGRVQPDEEPLIEVPPGTLIKELPPLALQRIAVHRSKRVGLAKLYNAVQEELGRLPPGDRIGRNVMEGIAARLEPLIYGQVGEMFGAGEGTVAISDLAQPWGLCVIEGGDHLDEFCKIFLLAWLGWHAYEDAAARYERGLLSSPDETVQIFYEELNKILTGVKSYGDDEEGGGGDYLVAQLSQQWLDTRKVNAWLHGITQVPSLIPRPVRQSCNNVFFGNTKGTDDRDIEVGTLARSEKGFIDEPWRRWLARLPWAQMVVKLGYAADQAALEPMKIRPAMLSLPKPPDDALAQLLRGPGSGGR